jgi:hypothetical protein
LQGIPDPNSYRVASGKATLTTISHAEIAKVLGLRRNAVKLRELYQRTNRRIDGKNNCVVAVELLLAAEYDRIGAEFESEAYESIITVFWHAYSKVRDAVEIIGTPEGISRIMKKKGMTRLADELTDRPSLHRFLYRSTRGLVRTALDQQALNRVQHDRSEVIDLEVLARRLSEGIGRPLLTLQLREASPSQLSPANLNAPIEHSSTVKSAA